MTSREEITRAENYYRAISELTVARHREHLIKELLNYMASLLNAVEEANSRLTFSEARIRAIVNTAADGILTYDESGNIDSINPAAAAMFGLNPESIQGLHVSSLLEGESEGHLRTVNARQVGGGYEDVAKRGNNTFPVYIAVQDMRLADRMFHVAILRDITDQKNAQRLEAQARAKEETDKILSAIDQGLFLIYRDGARFEIGSQFSRATRDILGVDLESQKDLLSILGNRVAESTIAAAKNFLELMFKDSVREESLRSLNPLSEIPFASQTAGDTRTLQFTFRRVTTDQKITHLMATVSDVTEEAALREQLKQNEQQSRTQMEMLLKILHVDSDMLDEFIDETRLEIDIIDTILKKEDGDLRKRLETIFRTAHKIKGNADLLGLSFFAEQIHSFEDTLSVLLRNEEISPADFLPVLFAFNKVTEIVDAIDALVERLLDFKSRFGQSNSGDELILRSARALINKLTDETGKLAELHVRVFEARTLGTPKRKLIRDVITQLIKNSMMHGIETPETRTAGGKRNPARIELNLRSGKDGIFLNYKDDGQGLHLSRLKEKAIKQGIATEAEIATWPPAKTAELIFATGLSTSLTTGIQSGRGIGMGLIREAVHDVQGKIRILSAPAKFFEVQIWIPVA
ncbi:MAG TPA: PAS domain S-box protein [Leptospiraceae bacterium]|nr:PAS domain S-box protein [Leptospiraceae bacterium]HNJ35394.1 PAS domain S-box protein [Leptospiraceae bacterium]